MVVFLVGVKFMDVYVVFIFVVICCFWFGDGVLLKYFDWEFVVGGELVLGCFGWEFLVGVELVWGCFDVFVDVELVLVCFGLGVWVGDDCDIRVIWCVGWWGFVFLVCLGGVVDLL